jgi:CRP/FNR family transcriptional regulator
MSGAAARTALDKIGALKKTELFSNLSDAVLSEVASHAISRQVRAGEVLFSEHDNASGVYVVVQGEFRSIRQNAKGREQVLSTERAGAVLAAASVFSGGKFHATTIAETDSQVICLDNRDIVHLCEEHPELLWAIATIFARKLRHYAELIETLALRNVDQRVAQYILTICQELGVNGNDTCTVEIKMTQTEMAGRIGSTREVVCRAMAHLQARDLVRMQGTRIISVPSVRALSKFAGVQHELDEPLVVSELSAEIA